MDEAAAVRRAALGAVGGVTPQTFRDDIEGFIADGSLVPGVVTLATAAAAGAVPDSQTDRAAGVQLVYDGLRLTRRLSRENPWDDVVEAAANAATGDGGPEADAGTSATGRDPADPDARQPTTEPANVDILAADVLVARGFSLLADTDAADDAVEVVRAFGRDETERRTAPDPARFEHELEADVLHLALVAGATADGGRPVNTGSLVADLVDTWDGRFPDPGEVVDDRLRQRLANATTASGRPLNRND